MRNDGAPGGRWLGSYELVRLLARGGMAEVYEARRLGARGFSKRVAVKRILPQLLHDERLVQMFCHEATTLAALDHPNLCGVVDFGEHGGEPYMALEYVEGISCQDLISGVAARKRTVELGPALHIAAELLDALAYVHAARNDEGQPLGIVHRDVAPTNILLGRAGEVKLADFGIVRGYFIPSQTEPGEFRGKVGYISPEQAMGRAVDARSDLFSLGVVLAELCIARSLFSGPSDMHVLSSLCAGDLSALAIHGRHVPPSVHAILSRALARDPAARYPDAASFKLDVERAVREHDAATGAHGLAAYLLDLGLVRVQSTIRPSTRRRAFAAAVSAPVPAEADAASSRAALPDEVRASIPDDVKVTVLGAEAPRASSPPVSDPDVYYRIRRASGTIIGPLPLATLLEMVATGRVGVDTFVARNGGPFIAAASLHELARLAARPAYRFFDPVELHASERRRVDRISLARYLYGLVIHQRSGLLCAKGASEQSRLYFSDGALVMSASTRPAALLGSLAVGRGALTASELGPVLETGWRGGRQLGEELVARGILSAADLQALLEEQLCRRAADVCRLFDGELFFVDSAPCSGYAVAPHTATLSWVTRAVLESYGGDELVAILERAWVVPLRPTPAFATLEERLGLPVAERIALRRACHQSLYDMLGAVPAVGSAADRALLVAVFVGVSSGALRFRRAA